MNQKPYFSKLVVTASCVIWSVDVENNFTVFPNTSNYIPHVYDGEPRSKDPPLDNQISVLNTDLSPENTGL